MVDDHQVGLGGALPHSRDEALVVPGTLGSEARFGGGGHLVPERAAVLTVVQHHLGYRFLRGHRAADTVNSARVGVITPQEPTVTADHVT